MNQLVFIKNGQAVTDSLTVAEVFGKEHRRVLQDIRVLECSENFRQHNFVQSTYINSQNKEMPKFLMNRKGFTLLAMGYTGKQAMEFKETYIEKFEEMEKKLTQLPRTQLEILQGTINQLVEQEQRLTAIETRTDAIELKQNNITEVLSLNQAEWRKKTTNLLNRIAQQRGGYEAYKDVRAESYLLLEERAKCLLSKRLTNKKGKAALEGMAKSKIDKLNKMDVIADDARLTEIYLAIVKEMAVRYEVDAS